MNYNEFISSSIYKSSVTTGVRLLIIYPSLNKDNKKLTLSQKEVFEYYHTLLYTTKKENLFVSQERIASETGISITTVNTSIKALKNKGLLILTKKGCKIKNENNTYKLNYDYLAELDKKYKDFLKENDKKYNNSVVSEETDTDNNKSNTGIDKSVSEQSIDTVNKPKITKIDNLCVKGKAIEPVEKKMSKTVNNIATEPTYSKTQQISPKTNIQIQQEPIIQEITIPYDNSPKNHLLLDKCLNLKDIEVINGLFEFDALEIAGRTTGEFAKLYKKKINSYLENEKDIDFNSLLKTIAISITNISNDFFIDKSNFYFNEDFTGKQFLFFKLFLYIVQVKENWYNYILMATLMQNGFSNDEKKLNQYEFQNMKKLEMFLKEYVKGMISNVSKKKNIKYIQFIIFDFINSKHLYDTNDIMKIIDNIFYNGKPTYQTINKGFNNNNYDKYKSNRYENTNY